MAKENTKETEPQIIEFFGPQYSAKDPTKILDNIPKTPINVNHNPAAESERFHTSIKYTIKIE